MIHTERKYVEILRILKEHQDPVGAKRLSELMAERGFVMSDRAVQYYLSYLDEMGFTQKIGNYGRVLTENGISETERALVGGRIGFIISKLERLAFRSTFNPETGTGEVGYNLTRVPEPMLEGVIASFEQVKRSGLGFFNGYRIIDKDPRIPKGTVGIMSVCSITMDGVYQRLGVPVRMAFGGRLSLKKNSPESFLDVIAYSGTTVDPLQIFISAGLTSVQNIIRSGNGIALANVREVPAMAEPLIKEVSDSMVKCGFNPPVRVGRELLNLQPDPSRISIVSFSGMNYIGNSYELGYKLETEIGAGNIAFSKICDEI